jgi:hypothetical protein
LPESANENVKYWKIKDHLKRIKLKSHHINEWKN